MDECKIAESTNSVALSQLRANRVLLARRINEIAVRMLDLRIELETLDEEMKAEVHQLREVDRVQVRPLFSTDVCPSEHGVCWFDPNVDPNQRRFRLLSQTFARLKTVV
jgi:hypothetical protein